MYVDKIVGYETVPEERVGLTMFDEATEWTMVSPSKTRTYQDVESALYRLVGKGHIREIKTDAAPEPQSMQENAPQSHLRHPI